MASVLRETVLRHIRLPLAQSLTLNGSKVGICSAVRSMSSHGDDHVDKQEVAERVLDVVKSFPKVDPSKVTPDVHFQKDLGLDSLDNVEIVMALEEEFKLEIPDKEADKINSCPLAIEHEKRIPLHVTQEVIATFGLLSSTYNEPIKFHAAKEFESFYKDMWDLEMKITRRTRQR